MPDNASTESESLEKSFDAVLREFRSAKNKKSQTLYLKTITSDFVRKHYESLAVHQNALIRKHAARQSLETPDAFQAALRTLVQLIARARDAVIARSLLDSSLLLLGSPKGKKLLKTVSYLDASRPVTAVLNVMTHFRLVAPKNLAVLLNQAKIADLQARIQELQRERQAALTQQNKFFGALQGDSQTSAPAQVTNPQPGTPPSDDPIQAERKKRAYLSLFSSNVALSYRKDVPQPESASTNNPLGLQNQPPQTPTFDQQLSQILQTLPPIPQLAAPVPPVSGQHQTTLKTVWRKTLRRAKVAYFRIYDLRSTYATRLSAGGVAEEWVIQMLRQSDAQVFKKYSQMKLQMKREALGKLNRRANEMTPPSPDALMAAPLCTVLPQ